MRTTVDLPDTLYRRTKAVAALRGSSLKELIISAPEREVNAEWSAVPTRPRQQVALPLVHLRRRRKLDLSKFNLDDLLA